MIRILALAFTLTACAGEQIAPDAQMQLQAIAADYVNARLLEEEFCQQSPKCEAVRTAGYQAEGAYVTAQGQRTASAINDARAKVGAYSKAAGEL